LNLNIHIMSLFNIIIVHNVHYVLFRNKLKGESKYLRYFECLENLIWMPIVKF